MTAANPLPSYFPSTLSEERLATQTVIARHDSAEATSWRGMGYHSEFIPSGGEIFRSAHNEKRQRARNAKKAQ